MTNTLIYFLIVTAVPVIALVTIALRDKPLRARWSVMFAICAVILSMFSPSHLYLLLPTGLFLLAGISGAVASIRAR